jgi:hypothetical protein
MKNCFCTLFDSKYIDKGLALYSSLASNCSEFKLYVLAMDSLCENILKQLQFQNMIIISLNDFEDETLRLLKRQRSNAEYCWTCTPKIIRYVIDRYRESCCTYIDADLYFYSDPECLIDEMLANGCSIQVVEHRFEGAKKEKNIAIHGRYCVEFNTFLNDEYGLACLEWWEQSCLKECRYTKMASEMVGDQKYLEFFEEKFGHTHVLENIGGGLAPWNFNNYTFMVNNSSVFVKKTKTKGSWNKTVFCHFQNIRYLPFHFVNTNSHSCSKVVLKNFYIPYLQKIESIRSELFQKFNLTFEWKKSCYKNPFKKIVQEYIMGWFIRGPFDLVKIKENKNDSMQ